MGLKIKSECLDENLCPAKITSLTRARSVHRPLIINQTFPSRDGVANRVVRDRD